jgi:Flp pilus assembly protein TadG
VRFTSRGQSITEAIVVLPLFLAIVFLLLQLGQLGMALIMANYAASSIARKAVAENNLSAGNYQQVAQQLMVAGMQYDSLVGCPDADQNQLTGNFVVLVRAKVVAWPFVGYVMNAAFKANYTPQALSCSDLTNQRGFGPFNYLPTLPQTFYVTGTGKVRLNYKA